MSESVLRIKIVINRVWLHCFWLQQWLDDEYAVIKFMVNIREMVSVMIIIFISGQGDGSICYSELFVIALNVEAWPESHCAIEDSLHLPPGEYWEPELFEHLDLSPNLDIGLTFLCCKPAVSRCSLTRKSSKSMELWGPWQQRLWSIRMESPVLGEVVTLPVEIRKVENYCGTLVQLALVWEDRFTQCLFVIDKSNQPKLPKYLLWSGRLKNTLHQSPALPYVSTWGV